MYSVVLAVMISFVSLLMPKSAGPQDSAPPRANVKSPHGDLNRPCQDCHTFTSWKPIRSQPEFDHNKTRYPLRGLHQNVGCTQCHTSLVFSNASTRCADCHADIHRRQFGANCEQCHTVLGWQVDMAKIRNHDNRFPLVGAHALLECDACHKGAASGQFVGLSTACISCHTKDFQTPLLDHRALGLSTSCQTCHSMDNWFGASFDHLRFTGFALTGAHATLDCVACHAGGVFKNTPSACIGCHLKDVNGTTNPNHAQAGFPSTCQTCHSTVNWTDVRFDHTAFTKFPLTGAHVTVACAQCHINGAFANTPTDCYSCHTKDFTGTTNPAHVAAGFPTTCQTCHTTAAWTGAVFDHNTTHFPLTGAHTNVACATCHINGVFVGTPSDCYSCHTKDYTGATNPNHATAGFPTTCATCHNTTAWTGAVFDHNKTPFPLTGAHTSVACSACHINNVFAGTPTDCYSCHTKDYAGTTNPNHKTAGFGTTCETCHTTTAWTGAVFDHNKTAFPLTGAHTSVACASCHINNVFAGHADRLLLLPYQGLHRDYESKPCERWLPNHLPDLPHDDGMDRRRLRSQQDVFPLDRRTHFRGLHQLPHQQRVRRHADRLLLLPHQGLHRHHQSQTT